MSQKAECWLVAAIFASVMGTASAQTPAAAPSTPAATAADKSAAEAAERLAQVKQFTEVLTTEVAKSNERMEAINQQLRSLDKDIEGRVDRIVALLATVKDSTDSRGRVRRSKDKAIMGLRNSISFYVRERDRRNQELAAGGSAASKEGLAGDVDKINTRIEKRVEQILSLANSMTQHEEFNRYERYRNDEYDYSSETKEFRRFEKDVDGSAKSKADVIQDLKGSIEKQKREIAQLRETLPITNDAQRKERLQSLIDEKEEIISERRQQVEELLAGKAPDAKPISSKGAFELDKLLADMTLDLQRDFRKFQQLVSERNEAQDRVRYNQERLDRFLKSQQPAATK